MIFGNAPIRDVATASELEQAIMNRPTPLGEYITTNVVDAFVHSDPGMAAAEVALPDDYTTGKMRPVLPGEKAPVTKEDYLNRLEPSNVPILTEEQWKESPYYRSDIPYDSRMTVARAANKAEVYDAQQFRNFQRQNREWGIATVLAAVGGSILGTAPDPINYIPIFGEAFKAAAATRTGAILARAGLAAADNAILTGVTDLALKDNRKQFGEDMSMADVMLDVALGAAFGGVMGGVHGWREKLAAYDPDTGQKALVAVQQAAEQLTNDEPIDIHGIVESIDQKLIAQERAFNKQMENLQYPKGTKLESTSGPAPTDRTVHLKDNMLEGRSPGDFTTDAEDPLRLVTYKDKEIKFPLTEKNRLKKMEILGAEEPPMPNRLGGESDGGIPVPEDVPDFTDFHLNVEHPSDSFGVLRDYGWRHAPDDQSAYRAQEEAFLESKKTPEERQAAADKADAEMKAAQDEVVSGSTAAEKKANQRINPFYGRLPDTAYARTEELPPVTAKKVETAVTKAPEAIEKEAKENGIDLASGKIEAVDTVRDLEKKNQLDGVDVARMLDEQEHLEEAKKYAQALEEAMACALRKR